MDMAKTVGQKLISNRYYKSLLGDTPLSTENIERLRLFDNIIGFTHDRACTLTNFIIQDYPDWVYQWNQLKRYHNSTLAYLLILYGNDGERRYKDSNAKKTAHFDHSSETQKRKADISAAKSRGNKSYSCRTIGYWVKKGFSPEEAKNKIAIIQATNTIDRYKEKYGQQGNHLFHQRRLKWTDMMNNPNIHKSRSTALWRYIERYGEVDGFAKYIQTCKNRASKILANGCRASKESLIAFDDIIHWLDNNKISYYIGHDGNKEWFIYDDFTKRVYFYDLTIPSLHMIIEYHGEAFHPNPNWDSEKWKSWKSALGKRDAATQFKFDQYKRLVAENNGWSVIELFSSYCPKDIELLLRSIHNRYNRLFANAN